MYQKRTRVGSSKKRLWQRKLRALFMHALFTLIFCSIFLGAVAFLLRLSGVTIHTIEVSGNTITSSSELQETARQVIAGSYFYIFTKKNIFIFPRRQIEQVIAEKYKRIRSVSVERKNLYAISIDIAERTPHALWCGKELPGGLEETVRKEDCYYMDDSGYIFAKAPLFSGIVFFKYFGAITAVDPIGQFYLSPDEFKDISQIETAFSNSGIHAVALAAKEAGDFELQLKEGGRLLFNQKSPIAKVVADMSTVISSSEFQKELTDSSRSLDYIDIRFDNKIFYKFR